MADYTDFGYTNQRDYSYIGLQDYKARLYSPSLGRFTQPDSIVPDAGNPQAWNRYSYVLNSPLMYIDPSGHMTEKPCADDGLWCGGTGAADDPPDTDYSVPDLTTNDPLDDDSNSSNSSNNNDDNPDISNWFKELQKTSSNNFLMGLDICSNPNTTFGQKMMGCSYIGVWGVALALPLVAGGLAAPGAFEAITLACLESLMCSTLVMGITAQTTDPNKPYSIGNKEVVLDAAAKNGWNVLKIPDEAYWWGENARYLFNGLTSPGGVVATNIPNNGVFRIYTYELIAVNAWEIFSSQVDGRSILLIIKVNGDVYVRTKMFDG